MPSINNFKITFISLIVILIFIISFYEERIYACEKKKLEYITLNWSAPKANEDGSELTDLSGFILYYGTEPGHYTNSIDVGIVSNYQLYELINETTYYFAVTALDTSGNESGFSEELSKTVQISDTTPPVISVVYISNITENSAKITWVTDEASDSQIEYGTTTMYGHISALDESLQTIHSQTISLLPSRRYYYRIYSRDASGNLVVSENRFFFTE